MKSLLTIQFEVRLGCRTHFLHHRIPRSRMEPDQNPPRVLSLSQELPNDVTDGHERGT